MKSFRRSLPALAALALPAMLDAQDTPRTAPLTVVPRLASIPNATSELVNVVQRYALDEQALSRRFDAPDSPAARKRLRDFYGEWRQRLREHDFDRLSREGQVDFVLLDNHLQHELALLDRRDRQRSETAPLLPFADALLSLHDTRRNLATINQQAVARTLADVAKQVHVHKLMWGMGINFGDLVRSLATDPEYVRSHTRLLLKAMEWDQADRDDGFLLRGKDLKTSEEWFQQTVEKEPKPTDLQKQYLAASRELPFRKVRRRNPQHYPELV